MLLLGYDIGTSSVKAALVDAQTGQTVASAQYPDNEAPIVAQQPGWAEQEPSMWWDELKCATARLAEKAGGSISKVKAIGISYQMHGLVCVDKDGQPLRPSIIWCDGRAVPYGNEAFNAIGGEKCLQHLLNSPGNFTAAKLAWVKDNEPELFQKIDKIMLPGDYIAMRLSGGQKQTTVSGLSEGMFWDFKNGEVSKDIMNHFGFPDSIIADIVPTFSVQCTVCDAVAQELGIPAGTPIAYRGGDQPNVVIENQKLEEVNANWPEKTEIRISDYMNRPHQRWSFVAVPEAGGYLGGPYFKIVIEGTDRALTATADAELESAPFAGTDAQLWRVDQLTDGTYRIMPKAVPGCDEALCLVSVADSTPSLAKFNFNSDNCKWNLKHYKAL